MLENKVKILEKWIDDESFKREFYAFHKRLAYSMGDDHAWYAGKVKELAGKYHKVWKPK